MLVFLRSQGLLSYETKQLYSYTKRFGYNAVGFLQNTHNIYILARDGELWGVFGESKS